MLLPWERGGGEGAVFYAAPVEERRWERSSILRSTHVFRRKSISLCALVPESLLTPLTSFTFLSLHTITSHLPRGTYIRGTTQCAPSANHQVPQQASGTRLARAPLPTPKTRRRSSTTALRQRRRHGSAATAPARLGYDDGSSTATPLSSHTTPLFLVNPLPCPRRDPRAVTTRNLSVLYLRKRVTQITYQKRVKETLKERQQLKCLR